MTVTPDHDDDEMTLREDVEITLASLRIAGEMGGGEITRSMIEGAVDLVMAAVDRHRPALPEGDDQSMTTWKRVDGDLIHGEYTFVTGRPDEDQDRFDPVEYRKQQWALVSDEVDVIYPVLGYCQHEDGDGPCEDDDVTWGKDQAGHWIALCADHVGPEAPPCPEVSP